MKSLRDHFLRIDARSLGLFRVLMGSALLYDLVRRWRWAREFYSNEGVLPNHNHIFNLRDKADVWSALHAFSSPGEAHFAFAVLLVFYVLYLVGYKTRVAQALAIVALVSLGGRNILLENAGNYAAIGLLLATLFLPLGSRFSVDALVASMRARDERRHAELNDRPAPNEDAIAAERSPGWSPASLAALAVMLQIALILAVSAYNKKGAAWQDGTALHYAIRSERLASSIGAAARSLPPAVLAILTRAVRFSEIAAPALLVVPFALRWTRSLAALLVLVNGLVLTLLLSLGLYGVTIVAASALLLPRGFWDAIEGKAVASRKRTVVYDEDCGVCLLIARLLVRLDLRGNLTFQGNGSLDELVARGEDGSVVTRAMPAEVTPELVDGTVLAIDVEGRVATKSRAVSEVIAALPLGWLVAWIMRVPGISNLLDVLYDAFATRRARVSVAIGKEACGVPLDDEGEAPPAPATEAAPFTKLHRAVTGALRDALALVIFAAALAQTVRANELPWSVPQGKVLAAVAAWPRMMARWDVLAPEPPRVDEVLTVDAQTRGGASVDLITQREPISDPGAMRGTGLGQLWNDYLYRMHQKEWFDFQRAFRDYLGKGGLALEGKAGDASLAGYDVYVVRQEIPAPGGQRPEATREKLFSHARGGRLGVDRGFLQRVKPEIQMKH